MTRRLALALLTMAVLSLPAAPVAWASATPTEQLKTQIDRVLQTLQDPALAGEERAAERRAAIRAIAAEVFDVAEMSKRTLGRHWSARTDAEREEVARLFGELLERSYLGKLETYSGEHVAYAGEAVDGDHAVVRTRVSTRNGTEVPIDYRMLRRGERWMVYDVVIEGVSLVANYRSQFDRIIRSASYAEFVKRLRARIDEPPADSRAAAR